MNKQTTTIAIIIIIALAATAHYYQLDKLVTIQSAINQQDANWTAGITSVSHLSVEDKLAMSGARYSPPPPDAVIVSRPTPLGVAAPADPPSFDWRNVDGVDWMTSVKHQGYNCGSCWAFSAVGVVEAVFNIQTNNMDLDYDLSEQYLVSSCCNAGSCNGGWPDWAFDHMRFTGIPNETCFPYIADDSACTPCSGWKGNPYKIENNVFIPATELDYKWALQTHGPLSVCMTHPEDWFYYTSGVYEPVWTSEGFGWADHAVILVGWNDSLGAWICKNSHGKGWGYDGYGYVKYDTLLYYDYAYGVTEVIPHDDEPTPTPSDAQIDDDTDTITVDQSSYIPGDDVYMTASGINIGDETWSGSVFFYSTSPSGYTKEEYTYSLTVVPGATRSVTGIMTLPSDAEAGIWTIKSKWIKDDGTVDAMSIITI